MNKIIIIPLCFLLSGCATAPSGSLKPQMTQEQFAKLDFGSPISIDYKVTIKKYFNSILSDPYSAVYADFSDPQKYWIADPYTFGGKQYIGYIVFLTVNAKNKMGGYVGAQKYGFLFRDNEIIKIMQPEDFGLQYGE